ncbi:DUF2835 family protein [Bermanella sp. R86510]|uniref:DUF2835 family protein n=1 Tax=unclassified Bermanella TaxID=2627862 RepID=UPI0037C91D74
MHQIIVDIHIDSEELQRAYQGVEHVYAQAIDGRRIRFPVKILWKFIGHNGIHGRFAITYDQHNKFERVERLM